MGSLRVGSLPLEGVNATATATAIALTPSPLATPGTARTKRREIHSHIKCATVCIILMSLINHFYVGAKSKDGRANAVFQDWDGGMGHCRVSHMHPGKGVLRLWFRLLLLPSLVLLLLLRGYGFWVHSPPLHSSIKMRSGVSKTQARLHSGVRTPAARPVRLFIINTKKTPRTNCTALAPVSAPRLGMRKLP